MSRFKTKYRYSERPEHFNQLENEREIKKYMESSALFGLLTQRELNPMGTLSLLEGQEHWTPEQVKELKGSAHTSVVSALEKEDGTTNPSMENESSHITGGVKEYFPKPELIDLTKKLLVCRENFIHDKYGYCYYAIEPNIKPIIYNLFTEQEYRGKGFARKHLQYVINEIRQMGYTGEIGIEVIPNEDGIEFEKLKQFYIKMGLTILDI